MIRKNRHQSTESLLTPNVIFKDSALVIHVLLKFFYLFLSLILIFTSQILHTSFMSLFKLDFFGVKIPFNSFKKQDLLGKTFLQLLYFLRLTA